MKDQSVADPWKQDLLDFRGISKTFSNLVTSFDEGQVVSIEAGFGRGKTFFREGWAQELRNAGEVVIELDAQKSDHSGDPVVTFVGALAAQLKKEETKAQKALLALTKYGRMGVRAGARFVLREGADELIGEGQQALLAEVEGWDAFEDAIEKGGDAFTKAAGAVIVKQLATEKAREGIPKQLEVLRQALTGKEQGGRVIILIDELDRCHPDYALALLEAMKLVFDEPGFVFVLMVNADYLERIAEHRFGKMEKGERYLDKFVDMRLALPMTDAALSTAVEHLAMDLPLAIPFGDHEEFAVAKAARLAGELAPMSGLSPRQLKRVLLRIKMALLCYKDEPIDCALMVWLAFCDQGLNPNFAVTALPRAELSPHFGDLIVSGAMMMRSDGGGTANPRQIMNQSCRELHRIIERLAEHDSKIADEEFYVHCGTFCSSYIPRHQAMLDAIHQIDAN
ncbi:MAG: KAP family P-loop NTPase fold protein [Pelagimonas sp.]|uniref:KAP family P-loop NTPase fold protein n=1 Tax=Pelagimonas sp. TaxID=2073170 RepID=UPI003D6BE03D